jgi:hypothetical protein
LGGSFAVDREFQDWGETILMPASSGFHLPGCEVSPVPAGPAEPLSIMLFNSLSQQAFPRNMAWAIKA